MLDLSGATSNYACAWCKIHKAERWNMTYDLNHYNSPDLQRTLKEMNELANKKTKQKYFCVNPPILNIELDHVILDELHLLLRIMDILIENLVHEALRWDEEDNWKKRKCEQKTIHLDHIKRHNSVVWSFFRYLGENQRRRQRIWPIRFHKSFRTRQEEITKRAPT